MIPLLLLLQFANMFAAPFGVTRLAALVDVQRVNEYGTCERFDLVLEATTARADLPAPMCSYVDAHGVVSTSPISCSGVTFMAPRISHEVAFTSSRACDPRGFTAEVWSGPAWPYSSTFILTRATKP